MFFHFVVLRNASSVGVSLLGKGFINSLSSTKLVTRRSPPFDILTRQDGVGCTAVILKSSGQAKTLNDSSSSNFSCNKRRLSLL